MRNKSKSSDDSNMRSKKSDLPVGKKSVSSVSKKSDVPMSSKSENVPVGNMRSTSNLNLNDMIGSHHDSIHNVNAMKGHSHGGGANNGGKDGNLKFGNSALTKRRDVDGDMPGGSKGKK